MGEFEPGAERLHVWLPSLRAGSGADVYTQRLADGLCRAGVKVTLDWFDHRYEFMPALLRRASTPVGIDVIHANAGIAFAFAGRGFPLVVTDHHYVMDPLYRPFKSALQHAYHRMVVGPALSASYRSAEVVVTDSEFSATKLHTYAGITRPRVIPLWADYDEFSSGEVKQAPGSPFTLFFVGNNSRRKGFDLLAPLARSLGAGFEIWCTAGLRASSATDMPPNIRFLGRLSQAGLVDAYRRCDAVLTASRYEGFGYAALEGMACGKPVVGFACGAVDEVVEHGVSGILVPVDALDALADAIRTLQASPEKCQAMGEAGRERAISIFSEEAGVAAYIALYREVVTGHGTSA